jgi:glyoxylase-like metal-dependent hydrolase (beta-lactamase superfamily II)
MIKKSWIFLMLAFALIAAGAKAQDAKTVIQNAQKAMGDVHSIQYVGTGSAGALGQNWNPASPWHPTIVTSYTRTIDYVNGSSKEEVTRTQQNPPAKGGELPFVGELKQVNLISGQWAWNAPPGGVIAPAPAADEERQLQIWLTPHGFLRGAADNKATVSQGKEDGKTVTVLTFMDGNGHKIVGDIDERNLVTKVDSWMANPVLGDMLIETTFTDYKDFGGIKFPTRFVQKQGGFPVLDLTVTSAKANIPNAFIQLPGNVDTVANHAEIIGATVPPVNVESQKMADGVWFIGGGTHNSVLIEFKDYVAVVEAPNDEARSTAVIAEVHKLAPNKPIKYIINTHHHFDHTGGLRTYVAEGATVITQEGNKAFFETAWSAPRTLQPDAMSMSGKKATFITFKDKYELTDGSRVLDLYHLQGDNHNEFMSVGYLPKEKILIEADDYTPAPPNAPAMNPISMGFANNLYDNLQRLKLEVVQIAPLHGMPAPMSRMLEALGKTTTSRAAN